MNVVDTSAIVALLFGEANSYEIEQMLISGPCAMAATTRVELGIVVESRAGAEGAQLLEELLDRVEMQIVPVDARLANEALVCWRRFGKGRHRASLNFGDTFSYALAEQMGLPLLYVGEDFAQTDVNRSDTGTPD
ncbi:MAG: type II toxin-antitoxin system VapC family toxin [Acidimicrobiaceae bacterium]|nr:type II toxin-antitoxin system VapC family toxin [Acidimicrobiaceae bacterium]MDE0606355.1 type II toxin-antitoxin system VapC family toxin [Acidimicrobiaceae bacterium]